MRSNPGFLRRCSCCSFYEEGTTIPEVKKELIIADIKRNGWQDLSRLEGFGSSWQMEDLGLQSEVMAADRLCQF